MRLLGKLALGLALSLFGIASALILIETAFRLTELKGAAPEEWSDRPKFYYKAESAPTLQDFAYTAVKPADTYRIALIGDSYSFAPYMQFLDAFPKKLEQMLNLNQVALKGQVINYGVPAYSTTHEVSKVQQAIEEQADLVLLQITLNDPELKPYVPTGINLNLPDRFGRFSPSEKQARIFSWFHSWRFVAQRLHNRRTHKEYEAYFTDLFETPRTWNAFKKAIGEIQAACERSKTRLAAVVFPLFGLPMDESYPFYPIHKKVDELLTSLGIAHTDLSGIYRGIPLERLQVMPGKDRHPNEIAHRMAAEEIYEC